MSCRDTSEPSEIPSSTSTVWVRIGGTVSGLPAIAATPTAIMAPVISPPGRCSKRNSTPPAAPITSVSSTLRVLARLGMAEAIDAGMRLTPPYGKSGQRGQMRQRDAAMHAQRRALRCILQWPTSRSAAGFALAIVTAVMEMGVPTSVIAAKVMVRIDRRRAVRRIVPVRTGLGRAIAALLRRIRIRRSAAVGVDRLLPVRALDLLLQPVGAQRAPAETVSIRAEG